MGRGPHGSEWLAANTSSRLGEVPSFDAQEPTPSLETGEAPLGVYGWLGARGGFGRHKIVSLSIQLY